MLLAYVDPKSSQNMNDYIVMEMNLTKIIHISEALLREKLLIALVFSC